MKRCEICYDEFEESRRTQKYCKICGKNPERARKKYAKAEITNKINAGDLYKVKEITCKECGKVILTTYNRNFCSTICSELNRIKTARCPICKELLINKGNEKGRGYCSDECKQLDKLQKAKENGNYIPCKVCGKHFIRVSYSNEYCSRNCYDSFIKENKLKKQSEQSDIGTQKNRTRKCKHCGKSFTLRKGSMGQKFCDADCRKANEDENKRKELDGLKLGVDTNICTVCRTSQSDCERFTSNFVYSPKGAKTKKINDKYIIVYCPKFK